MRVPGAISRLSQKVSMHWESSVFLFPSKAFVLNGRAKFKSAIKCKLLSNMSEMVDALTAGEDCGITFLNGKALNPIGRVHWSIRCCRANLHHKRF